MHALITTTNSFASPLKILNLHGCGIFIGLKKAFDTVNHAFLLTRLNHYGIRGNVHEWFKSYLSHME